jgi:hypothetical protein
MRAEQHRLSRRLMPQKSNSKLLEQDVEECRPKRKTIDADEARGQRRETRMPADKEGDSTDGWWMSWSRRLHDVMGVKFFGRPGAGAWMGGRIRIAQSRGRAADSADRFGEREVFITCPRGYRLAQARSTAITITIYSFLIGP